MPNCSKCGNVCPVTKRKHSICLTCKRIADKAWRDKRRAEGRPIISTKMPKEYWAEYERRNLPAKKKRVRGLTKSAIKQGIIPKQPCEVCGSKFSEVHHITYDSPYQIKWLCKTHHHEEHNRLKAEGK